MIDTATGADGAESLADDAAATEVRDELPDQRFAEAWLSADGIDDAGRRTTRGPLGDAQRRWSRRGRARGRRRLAERRRTTRSSSRSAARSTPSASEATPGFFAAFPAFEPDAAERLRPDDARLPRHRRPGARRSPRCSSQASAQAPGDRRGLRGPGRRRCASEADVDLEASCSARSATRRRSRSSRPPGEPPASTAPAAAAVPAVPRRRGRRGRRPGGARRLQGPLADASPGQRPGAGLRRGRGRGCRRRSSLRVSPAVELTYAVFDGLAAVATDPAGIARRSPAATAGSTSATSTSDATDGFPDEVSLLAYLRPRRAGDHRRAGGPGRGPGRTRRSPATSGASTRSGSRSRPPTTCSRPTPGCCSGRAGGRGEPSTDRDCPARGRPI